MQGQARVAARQGAVPKDITEGNLDSFMKKEYLYKFSVDVWYPTVRTSHKVEQRKGKACIIFFFF
jgi:hypothetical protein